MQCDMVHNCDVDPSPFSPYEARFAEAGRVKALVVDDIDITILSTWNYLGDGNRSSRWLSLWCLCVAGLLRCASMGTLVTGMTAGVELVAGATTTSGELDTGVATTSSRIAGRG